MSQWDVLPWDRVRKAVADGEYVPHVFGNGPRDIEGIPRGDRGEFRLIQSKFHYRHRQVIEGVHKHPLAWHVDVEAFIRGMRERALVIKIQARAKNPAFRGAVVTGWDPGVDPREIPGFTGERRRARFNWG